MMWVKFSAAMFSIIVAIVVVWRSEVPVERTDLQESKRIPTSSRPPPDLLPVLVDSDISFLYSQNELLKGV